MDRRHLVLGALAFISALAAGSGCSSSEDAQIANVEFSGVYRPANAGNISAIAFMEHKHYLLMTSSCRERACAESGSYVFDRESSVLSLTDASTGRTRTLSIKVLATTGMAPGSLVKSSLRPMEKLIDKTEQETITSGEKLIDKTGQETVKPGDEKMLEVGMKLIELITRAIMDGQEMNKDDDKGKDGNGGEGDREDDAAKDPEDCAAGIPTGETPLEEAAAYWARCPQGIAN